MPLASPVTIIVTQKFITSATSIDGGGLVTLSGDLTNRIICVLAGGALSLNDITLINGRGTAMTFNRALPVALILAVLPLGALNAQFGGMLTFCILFTFLGLRQFARRALD